MARTSAARQGRSSHLTTASASGTSSPGFTGTGDSLSDYGDRSSSYWPEGWNFQRYRNCNQEDLLALPEGQLEKLQTGFRDILGEAGVGKLAKLVFEEWSKRQASPEGTEGDVLTATPAKAGSDLESASATPAAEPSTMTPDWLRMYEKHSKGKKWGFVGLRTCSYDDDEKWEQFRIKLDGIARLPFEEDASVPGVRDAAEHFAIQWIEDRDLENASVEKLQEKFATIVPSLNICQSQGVFLAATPNTIDHFLDTGTPTTSSQLWRLEAPYILAVAASSDPGLEEGHDEREWFQEAFKVAAETLVSELWFALAGLEWSVRKVTRDVKGVQLEDGEVAANIGEGRDVWWSTAPSPERMSKRRRVTKTIDGVPVEAIINPYEDNPELVQRISHRKVKAPALAIVEPDPQWLDHFHTFESRILAAFAPHGPNDEVHQQGAGDNANGVTILSINHVGSTSVPHLPAKAVIDIDLVLSSNSLSSEPYYVPRLEAAGFQFHLREPAWHEHRFFSAWKPISCNLHVWGPQCAEVVRHRIFRDWLREHDDDRELYARTKKECAALSREKGEVVLEYTLRKNEVIQQILTRAFTELGYLS
ncbi:hypothetical protein LTR08_002235 [Meristemomyces frigidus]|nr:hypothetical protein LTR08_002235 [Meristemomyces frigidus]